MSKALSKKQQYWLDHNQAAEQSQLSLSAYAKQHQLNIQPSIAIEIFCVEKV